MIPVSEKEELEIKSHEIDFNILQVIVTVLSLGLIARLWFLQIYTGEELWRYSNMNRLKRQTLAAPRGFILDRNGEILAKNKRALQLKINLNYIEDLKETLNLIAPLSEKVRDKLKQKFKFKKKEKVLFTLLLLKKTLKERKSIF